MNSIVVVLVGLAAVSGVGAESPEHSPEEWETLLDLRVIESVLTVHAEQDREFEYPVRWTELPRFVKTLPEPFKERVPRRDSWGTEFQICEVNGSVVVVSLGRNRVMDSFTSEPDAGPEMIMPDNGADLTGDDIVLIVGETILNGPSTARERLNRTMADLRSAATAVEEYSIDHDWYPTQDKESGLLSDITELLAPTYIRRLPVTDAWGHQLLYWSDARNYVIVSAGADGLFERPYGGAAIEDAYLGGYTDPDTDMVFINGTFAQWPEERQD